jgi:hypothetical protein
MGLKKRGTAGLQIVRHAKTRSGLQITDEGNGLHPPDRRAGIARHSYTRSGLQINGCRSIQSLPLFFASRRNSRCRFFFMPLQTAAPSTGTFGKFVIRRPGKFVSAAADCFNNSANL